MKVLLAIAATIVAALGLDATAHATVVTGSVNDPAGDVPRIAAEEHPRDLKSFEVAYDDAQGLLTGRISHWDPQTYGPGFSGYHWFKMTAAIGVARGGTCDIGSTGGVRVEFRTPDDTPGGPNGEAPTFVKADVVGSSTEIAGEVDGTYDGPWTFTLRSSALVRRGYNCVTDIEATHLSSGTTDGAAAFCMGPAGTVVCPSPPPPMLLSPSAPQVAEADVAVTTPPITPVDAGGTAGVQQTSPPAARALSAARAESLVRGQLKKRFGRRFSQRSRRGYSLSCRTLPPDRATCRVAWRHRGGRYSGTVSVKRTGQGFRFVPKVVRGAVN